MRWRVLSWAGRRTWWLGNTQVKLIRSTHRVDIWWASWWSCQSLTKSAPWLLICTFFCLTCVCRRPLCLDSTGKNGTFCVGPVFATGQAQYTSGKSLHLSDFSPYRNLPRRAFTMWEVTLTYTLQSNSVKAATFTTKSSLSRVRMQIFCCLWNFVCK